MHFGYDLKGRFSGSCYIRRLVGHIPTQTSAQGLLETRYFIRRPTQRLRLVAAGGGDSGCLSLASTVRNVWGAMDPLESVPQREPIGPRELCSDRSGKNKLEQDKRMDMQQHLQRPKSQSIVAPSIRHHTGITHWGSYGPGASPSFLFSFV